MAANKSSPYRPAYRRRLAAFLDVSRWVFSWPSFAFGRSLSWLIFRAFFLSFFLFPLFYFICNGVDDEWAGRTTRAGREGGWDDDADANGEPDPRSASSGLDRDCPGSRALFARGVESVTFVTVTRIVYLSVRSLASSIPSTWTEDKSKMVPMMYS